MNAEIIIIGTGFGGLGMAHKLKEAGHDDILILEKADEVGGTWRENTYPGAECDIPSALYSYSFAQNPTWDYKWAKQKQILGYLKDFAADNDLRRHIRFGTTVIGASFHQGSSTWRVKTDQSDMTCRFLISAVGQLHHPKWPNIPGLDSYAGVTFHSAEWDHDVDLGGKKVGVIGVGASAVQFIPEIAKQADRLTVYQRTPNWVVDKEDRPYSRLEKWIAKRFPGIANLYRFGLWCQGEYIIYPVVKGAPIRAALMRVKNRFDMKKHIKDPVLRKTLTPDYPIGAKRILFSDNYYEAIARENVDLVTDPITEITAGGITTKDGRNREHDLIIYATGFYSNPFLKALNIKGNDGMTLQEHWKNGAYAYHGVMTHGFPNLFFLYGPNTNTGHTSIVFKLEQEIGYIRQLIERAKDGAIEVDRETELEFSAEMQERLSKLAWAKIEDSWYKDGEKIPNNWPGSSLEFKKRLKTPIWDHFEVTPQ